MSVIVSFRIPKELKEDFDKYNISSEELRQALERMVKQKKREEAVKSLKEFRATLTPLKGDYSTKFIREARDAE